jgi:hypothetical protein
MFLVHHFVSLRVVGNRACDLRRLLLTAVSWVRGFGRLITTNQYEPVEAGKIEAAVMMSHLGTFAIERRFLGGKSKVCRKTPREVEETPRVPLHGLNDREKAPVMLPL